MTGVYIKRENLDTDADMHTGRMPCEVRDWGDASTSQGMLKISNQPPVAKKMHGSDSPSQHSEGTNLIFTMILDF